MPNTQCCLRDVGRQGLKASTLGGKRTQYTVPISAREMGDVIHLDSTQLYKLLFSICKILKGKKNLFPAILYVGDSSNKVRIYIVNMKQNVDEESNKRKNK